MFPLFYRAERFLQILQNVVDMLRADREPDRIRPDPLLAQLGLGALAVRRGGRMDHQRFHVRDVRKQGEQLQVIRCGSRII